MEISSLCPAPKRPSLSKSHVVRKWKCSGELDLDSKSKQISAASQTLPKIPESIPKDPTRPTAGVHVAHLPTVQWKR